MSQPELKKIMDAALTQTGEESSMLLGQQLSIEESDGVNTNKITYFADMDDAIFVASIEVKEEYTGQFYMIFSLRDAILLSGLLLGIPPARISEKRKLAILEADDIDAFGEILNQVIGSFNSVFKSSLPQKIHLKLSTPEKFIPGVDQMSDAEPIPEGEYTLFRAQLKMEKTEMDRLNILIPIELVQQISPPATESEPTAGADSDIPISKDGTELAKNAEEGIVDAPAEKSAATVLLLEEDEQVREDIRQVLSSAGMSVIADSPKADIREICSKSNAVVVIVGVTDTEDRELALCIKINAINQDAPIPIIMCAPQWTRSAVLKALKYGARDIVLKPYVSEELVTKINRFLKSA